MHLLRYETSKQEPAPNPGLRAFGFGGFRLDLVREQLVGPVGFQVLRRKTFDTLRLLLDAAPALVSTDDLLDSVWGRHALSPSAVPHVIRELRRALGDSAEQPRYIETRHRRGYRMIPQVIRDTALQLQPTVARVTPGFFAMPEAALLVLINEMRDWSAADSSRQRLERLCRVATERGLTHLAAEADIALQSIPSERSLTVIRKDLRHRW